MKKLLFFIIVISQFDISIAQNKKPLDHGVYDGWQSFGEKKISNNGKYVVYSINPQEGDGKLVIQETTGKIIKEISRGYNSIITENDDYVVFKIKPLYKDIREAKIEKKKADDQPKDSIGIFRFDDEGLKLHARAKSYKTPEKSGSWVAIQFEKPEEKKKETKDSVRVKSPDRFSDFSDADEDEKPGAAKDEGGDLLLKNLLTGDEKTIKNVLEYFFNKKGTKLLFETAVPKKDSVSKPAVHLLDLASQTDKVIMKGLNDAKNFAIDEEGNQVSFVAERDSSAKAARKFYKLWYYSEGMDSAKMIADKSTTGVKNGWTISENAKIDFSKSGKRLYLGTAPILPLKDTSLPEIDRVNVDIWNYKDDYLQPAQLKNRDREEKRSYLAVFDWTNNKVIQLGNEKITIVTPTKEGDGDHFYGISDFGKRIASQWQGFTLKDLYVIDPATGVAKMFKSNFKGNTYPSFSGDDFVFYDEPLKQYYNYNAKNNTTIKIAGDIPYPLYDEDNDVPDDPNPHGVYKWMEGNDGVLIYDRYDVWKVDPKGKQKSICLTDGLGRKNKTQYRILSLDDEEKVLLPNQTIYFRMFDEKNKNQGLGRMTLGEKFQPHNFFMEAVNLGNFEKAKNNPAMVFSKETFRQSPNLFSNAQTLIEIRDKNNPSFVQLTNTNPQQSDYLWGTAELFKWTAYTGKQVEGVLYKPDNFDPKKKYPMIVYFYERLSQTLNNYIAPAPTPSRLNITYFTSNGYVVLVPDIWYKTGNPGKSAYDHIVSGTRAVVKLGFVDSTKIGLQGQSWGGYQIAHLITRTSLYAAAWAGAPVANMTSAYGGIRWGTGINRQFQYEKTQSRIGATLWEKQNLYIENSPLFYLPKVKTPLVIMANDADDAVPWYQGIELFTGLRRLGKPVWMLNYNNEAHNLVERKNRKDISIREAQFFDWMLKGGKPAKWLAEGVPAVMKERTLGLEVAD